MGTIVFLSLSPSLASLSHHRHSANDGADDGGHGHQQMDGCSGNELLLPDGIPWKDVCTGLGRRDCIVQERSVTFRYHILLIDSISDHNNGLGEFTSSFLLRLPIQHKLPHFKQFTSPAAVEEKRQKEIDCGNHERFSEKVTRTTNRW